MAAVRDEHTSYAFAVVVHNPPQFTLLILFSHSPIFIPEYFSTTIQRTCSADSCIFCIQNIDDRRGPHHFDTCHTGAHFGIQVYILTGYQCRALAEVEVYITFQVDGTNPVVSRGYFHCSPSGTVAFVNGFLQGGSA